MLPARFLALVGATLSFGAAAVLASPLAPPIAHRRSADGGDVAPLSTPEGTESIPDSYIVVFKQGTPSSVVDDHHSALDFAHRQDLTSRRQLLPDGDASFLDAFTGLGHKYDIPGTFLGYSGKFTPDVLEFIRRQPEVEYVERDSKVWTQEIRDPEQGYGSMIWDTPVSTSDVENGAPWGLARISHRKPLSFGTFNKYLFDHHGGEGVTAYVIDTGVNIDHVEFQGRAKWGKTIPQGDTDNDANGHGTHCAGTIASRAYGVAKAAQVVAVKVLGSNGSGSMSDVVAGVAWAVDDALAKAASYLRNPNSAEAKKHKGFVANMSLGGGKSETLEKVVNAAVDKGLHFAVAAGNENSDACKTSPAGADKPITVGASTINDERAYFSNIGSCVDVFAPGLSILSTWTGGNKTTNKISGTSMASPHVCGLLAYLLSIYPSAEFNPVLDKQEPVLESAEGSTTSVWTRLWQLAVGQLSFLNGFGGESFLLPNVAPVPKPPSKLPSAMTPKDLKAALVQLSSKDILTDINSDTPNLLVFNNATMPAKKH